MQEDVSAKTDRLMESLHRSISTQTWVRNLIETIILLRREIDLDHNWPRFERIIARNLHRLDLLPHRWLNSITDTYVDFGRPIQKVECMLISSVYMHFRFISLQSEFVKNNSLDYKHLSASCNKPNKFANYLERIDECFYTQPAVTIWAKLGDDIIANRIPELRIYHDLFGDRFFTNKSNEIPR